MKTSADLRARLKALHRQTAETPLFNPVFQLSLDLSREIEGGSLDLAGIGALVDELECEALESRAAHVRNLLGPVVTETNLQRLRDMVAATATDFEDFAVRWSRPLLHAVFTAHPTFLLTPAQSDAIADAVAAEDAGAVCAASRSRPAITLDLEQGIDPLHCLEGDRRDLLGRLALADVARDVGEFEEATPRVRPAQGRHLGPVPCAAPGVCQLWRQARFCRAGEHRQVF